MRLRLLLASAILPFLAGCGGGGGAGSPVAPLKVDGESATISAAQGAVLYSGATAAGSAHPNAKTAAPALGRTMSIGSLVARIPLGDSLLRSAASTGWNPIDGTNLYYKVSVKSLTTVDILLSTDGTANDAGSIEVTLVKGGPNHYPIVVRATVDVILPDETITGSETLTEYDKSGSNFNVKGNETSSADGVSIAFDLTDDAGTVTGNMSIKKGAIQLAYTNIQATSSGFSAEFTAGGVAGSVTARPDGSGNASATDESGPWSLTWDPSGNFSLTAPNDTVLDGNIYAKGT